MTEMLTAAFLSGLLAAMLRMATPILYAALGECLSERSGVLNLGIEGIMFFGALAAFLTARQTGSLPLAVAAAFSSGALLALVHAALTVSLGVSQHVSGLGLTIFSSGLALFVYRLAVGTPATPPQVEPFGIVRVPFLASIPFVGPVLFQHYLLTYLAVLLVPLLMLLIRRTHWGLALRATGENPEAADAMGVDVFRVRYVSVVLGGGLMAVGGAFLSIAQFNMFLPGIVAGRGWIAIALVVFGKWRPGRILLGAPLLGLIDALQPPLQAAGAALPYQYLLLLPYLATIVLLVAFARDPSSPGALLRAYRRE